MTDTIKEAYSLLESIAFQRGRVAQQRWIVAEIHKWVSKNEPNQDVVELFAYLANRGTIETVNCDGLDEKNVESGGL